MTKKSCSFANLIKHTRRHNWSNKIIIKEPNIVARLHSPPHYSHVTSPPKICLLLLVP